MNYFWVFRQCFHIKIYIIYKVVLNALILVDTRIGFGVLHQILTHLLTDSLLPVLSLLILVHPSKDLIILLIPHLSQDLAKFLHLVPLEPLCISLLSNESSSFHSRSVSIGGSLLPDMIHFLRIVANHVKQRILLVLPEHDVVTFIAGVFLDCPGYLQQLLLNIRWCQFHRENSLVFSRNLEVQALALVKSSSLPHGYDIQLDDARLT